MRFLGLVQVVRGTEGRALSWFSAGSERDGETCAFLVWWSERVKSKGILGRGTIVEIWPFGHFYLMLHATFRQKPLKHAAILSKLSKAPFFCNGPRNK